MWLQKRVRQRNFDEVIQYYVVIEEGSVKKMLDVVIQQCVVIQEGLAEKVRCSYSIVVFIEEGSAEKVRRHSIVRG